MALEIYKKYLNCIYNSSLSWIVPVHEIYLNSYPTAILCIITSAVTEPE